MIYFSALLVSLLLTIAMMPLLVRAALRFGIVDIPDARKVHRDPIPRIGGVAIAIGSIVPFVLWRQPGNFVAAYLAGAGILVVLGLLDDMRGLNYKIKFAGQIIAASIVIFYGGLRITNLGGLLPDGMILPEWFLTVLTLVAVVGVTNAINLSDGLDGLAGGVCFLSLCCLAYLAYAIEDATALFIAVSLAGAVFGFLRFNTHPATLFMGDAGSLFLGFSVITLSLGMTQGGSPLSPVLPLIILGVPVLDTVTVMAERLYHGRSPFMPDKNHFHHRIMRLGFYHTESVFFIYLIQGCLIIAAILFRFHSDWLLLGSYVIFSALILGGFFVAEKTGWKVRRFDLIDRVIKGQLKALVDRGVLIRLSFRVIEFGLPALVFATCFLPTAVPVYFQIVSAGLLGMLLFIWLLNKNWLRRIGLSLVLYLFIPFLIFMSVDQAALVLDGKLLRVMMAACLLMIFFVVLTLKFSRRKKGFHVTTMDFLIIFLVLIVPFISGAYLQYKNFGLIVAATIMLFFSFEVLIGELRDRLNRLALLTSASLLVVVMRGFVG